MSDETSKRKPRPPAVHRGPDVLHDIPGEGERLGGLSRQKVYEAHGLGLLEIVSFGGRSYVTDRSLKALPSKLKYVKSRKALRLLEARKRKAAEVA